MDADQLVRVHKASGVWAELPGRACTGPLISAPTQACCGEGPGMAGTAALLLARGTSEASTNPCSASASVAGWILAAQLAEHLGPQAWVLELRPCQQPRRVPGATPSLSLPRPMTPFPVCRQGCDPFRSSSKAPLPRRSGPSRETQLCLGWGEASQLSTELLGVPGPWHWAARRQGCFSHSRTSEQWVMDFPRADRCRVRDLQH